MRITYLLTTLGMGGAERQVVSLAKLMAKRGHAVRLVVLMPRQTEEWPTDLEVVHLEMRKKPLSLLAGLVKGRRAVREFAPDLLHSHTFPANMTARALRMLGSPTPLITTIHNVYEGGWQRMLAYRLTDGLSQCTTAVSLAAMEQAVRLRAVPAKKCQVVTNGIELENLLPDSIRREQLRAKMGVAEKFVWLAAGRITPAKDYPNLVRAFALLCATDKQAELWVAGEGADDEVERTQSLTAELGLNGQVRWLGLRRDLPALLDAADGFVLSSAWEGMPLALGEAMAMAKPVVATDVGGVRELVGKAGTISLPKNPESLAEAMRRLMQSPEEERHALGCAARLRIQGYFAMDAKADVWETLYREVIEGKH
jgi:glycosyltransferase involved in cell wall biosynthesis